MNELAVLLGVHVLDYKHTFQAPQAPRARPARAIRPNGGYPAQSAGCGAQILDQVDAGASEYS